MTITVPVEINNKKVNNFSEMEEYVFQLSMRFGQELLKQVLEITDQKLMAERDTERYRCKGKRATHLKTKMGEVTYARQVYLDQEAEGGKKYVYLLDKELNIEKIGRTSRGLCEMVADTICESTYRATARQIREQTAQYMSHQHAWMLVQQMGEKIEKHYERQAELDALDAGVGELVTKILYEENDGIWLSLQGPSREQYGKAKEMKVGIAYDGVTWKEGKNGKKRRTLHNKLAIAGFLPIDAYRKQKEGLIASIFRKDEIELRVFNGDGASWTLPRQTEGRICVLDEFHRNKKILECVKDKAFAKLIRDNLYAGEIDQVLVLIEAQYNSVMEEDEKAKLAELLQYYSRNRDALKGYYDRGIRIPETSKPGEIHHARLGSMESNVFSLIGNRMKDRRFNWSVNGANHLAALLCAYHTTGLNHLFDALPEIPVIETVEEWVDTGTPLSARQSKETEGSGYEYYKNISTTNLTNMLKEISHYTSLSEISL